MLGVPVDHMSICIQRSYSRRVTHTFLRFHNLKAPYNKIADYTIPKVVESNDSHPFSLKKTLETRGYIVRSNPAPHYRAFAQRLPGCISLHNWRTLPKLCAALPAQPSATHISRPSFENFVGYFGFCSPFYQTIAMEFYCNTFNVYNTFIKVNIIPFKLNFSANIKPSANAVCSEIHQIIPWVSLNLSNIFLCCLLS